MAILHMLRAVNAPLSSYRAPSCDPAGVGHGWSLPLNPGTLNLGPNFGPIALGAGNPNPVQFGAAAGGPVPSRWGKSRGFTSGLFLFPAPPILNAVAPITPNNGTALGGTAVTIHGSNFVGVTAVTVGGAAITARVVVNPNTITGVTAAHLAGPADVVVTTASGIATALAAYTYT